MTTTVAPGFTTAEQEARWRENLSTEPMQVTCALCEWTASGQAGEVMAAQREHRFVHGVKYKGRNRSTRHLSTFRQPHLTDDDREEIEAEVARRRRLHGLEDAA